MTIKQELFVAGLWYRGPDAVCVERVDRNGNDWPGHPGTPLSPHLGEPQDHYARRLGAQLQDPGSYLSVMMKKPRIVLTSSGYRTLRGKGDSLVEWLVQRMMARGFVGGTPLPATPVEKFPLCRLAPICGRTAAHETCRYCVECFEAMRPSLQVALLQAYNKQQAFTGACREFIKVAHEADQDAHEALLSEIEVPS